MMAAFFMALLFTRRHFHFYSPGKIPDDNPARSVQDSFFIFRESP